MGLRNDLWKTIFLFAGGFIDRTGNGGDWGWDLLKATGLTDSEISEANLLRTIVDRIPTTQARETIARCAIVRPE